MKTSKIVILINLFIFSLATFSSGQPLESFQDRLKKRGPVNHIRDKFYQEETSTFYYTPAPEHRNCAAMEEDAELRALYPEMGTLEDFEAQLQEKIAASANDIQFREVLTIPVIVHVVHNGESVGSGANISQAQVQSQIDVLNEDYRRTGNGFNNHSAGADVEIEFVMATQDPQGNILPEPGINRINGGRNFWTRPECTATLKPNTIWDPNRYCNIWTVQFGGESDGLLGYAQFPSLSNLPGVDQNEGPANTDGVVIGFQYFGRTGNLVAPYNMGRTTTHEIGHWLGLRHIWGDGDCSVDDFCGDTPNAGQPNYNCISVNSCGGNESDMIENFMDYSEDACMNVFTNDQKTRMRTVLENSPRRKQLINSTVGEGGGNTNVPVAFFSSDVRRACSGTTIEFFDQSSNSPTDWEWEFFDEAGNSLAVFTGQNQSITFNSPGLYSVELSVNNGSGSDAYYQQNYITILSAISYDNFIEDFEDLGTVLDEWVVYNPDGDRTFDISEESSFGVGNYSLVFDNFSTFDDPSGTVDAIISPSLDLSTQISPYLYFEHAYARFGGIYSDTLVLFYSLDCGASFTPFYVKGGEDLATAPPTQSSFIPTSNQWAWDQISLGFLAGQTNVHILIANISGWGNNLYLDQISLIDAFDYIQDVPEASFQISNSQVCEGSLVQFQDISSNLPSGWSWQFEGGSPSFSSSQHPSVQYSSPGTYDVILTASNYLGSTTVNATNFIEVVPLPDIEIFADQGSICGGEPVTLTATGGSYYEWYDERSGTLIFEGASITVTLYDDWEFSVIGYNDLGCESLETFVVEVDGPPTPTIDIQGNVLVASPAEGYQWYYEGQPIPSGQGGDQQAIQPLVAGNFIVEVFGPNGCSSISAPVYFDINSSTDQLEDISSSLLSFPNPTSGLVNLKMDNDIEGAFMLEVSNLLGQTLRHQSLEKTGQEANWEMDLGNYPEGVYLISIRNEQYKAVRKIVKQ